MPESDVPAASPDDPQAEGGATRAIRLEVEVPGTPEEVWAAIATGPGITSWFVPSTVREKDGRVDSVDMEFFPGSVEAARVTVYDAPTRFVYETAAEDGSHALAYEWLVEARDGGSCVVRLVNSGFGSGADWDGEYDSMHAGWKLFLHNLKLCLTHFPTQPCSPLLVMGQSSGSLEDTWESLTRRLGITVAPAGAAVSTTADDAPELAGVVERVSPQMLTLLTDKPGPGVAFVCAESMGGDAAWTSVYLYLFGDHAEETARRVEPQWRDWMQAHFAMGDEAPAGT